jgi:histidinol dehydrogenase
MQIHIWNELIESQRDRVLRRPALADDPRVRSLVAQILERVRVEGDDALRDLSIALDGATLRELEATPAEFDAAEANLAPADRAAIQEAAQHIATFHKAQLPVPIAMETSPGVLCERVSRPIQSVGLYVPAGTAPLPSTALMLGIPASLAKCPIRILCSPARADGSINSAVLYAARIAGIDRVFKLCGAQAIGAMAYGTQSVPKVEKVFGPGSIWVTEAKAQVDRDPGGAARDFPAGPSEVMVIADASANAQFVAADLLSQAEHGVDSQVLLVTTSLEFGTAVSAAIDEQKANLSRRRVIEGSLAA